VQVCLVLYRFLSSRKTSFRLSGLEAHKVPESSSLVGLLAVGALAATSLGKGKSFIKSKKDD
ncbi:PEP-CTERM sorting domain-containing protein, partial [Crocosphaera sp. Alani8]|uniref:PEP-CTERM sorting domain-containing protein n=1 Tax=Crocosphaera sp. Alani8 TaxID=3038952 RepID=UPI00313CAD47